MPPKLFAASMGFCALILFAAQLQAQTSRCAEHAVVEEHLRQNYAETRQSIGLNHDNTLIELYASTDTGTWTLTVTQPGGATCIVAAGQHYQHVAETLPALDPDA